jgi:hypothetical protein
MARDITPAVRSALQQGNVPMLLFMEAAFDSGTVRLTNALHDIAWNGFTWLGGGRVVGVDTLAETESGERPGLAVTLAGVDPALLAQVLAEPIEGRELRVWYAPLSSSYVILSDPLGPSLWLMNTPSIKHSGPVAQITVQCESPLTDLQRAVPWYYTPEHQEQLYPGDKFCSFASAVSDAQIIWPAREWRPGT